MSRAIGLLKLAAQLTSMVCFAWRLSTSRGYSPIAGTATARRSRYRNRPASIRCARSSAVWRRTSGPRCYPKSDGCRGCDSAPNNSRRHTKRQTPARRLRHAQNRSHMDYSNEGVIPGRRGSSARLCGCIPGGGRFGIPLDSWLRSLATRVRLPTARRCCTAPWRCRPGPLADTSSWLGRNRPRCRDLAVQHANALAAALSPASAALLNQVIASITFTGTPRPSRYNTPTLNLPRHCRGADLRNQLMASV